MTVERAGHEYENFTIPVENPIRDIHDMTTTRTSIRHMLAGGTPNWLKWPQDYKAFVKEAFQFEKEKSNAMVQQYKMQDQEILANPQGRLVNSISMFDFITTLRNNEVKCFFVDNGFPPQTVALWAARPGSDQLVYITYLQVPRMYEWDVLKLDRHGLPAGLDYRGWRSAVSRLITERILTEEKAHKIFGKPVLSPVSRIYRRTLWLFRNGKLDSTPKS